MYHKSPLLGCFFGCEKLWEHAWPFQLEWQSWAGLMAATFYRARYPEPRPSLSGSCTGEIWGVWELFWACLQIENKEGEADKRITVKIFTLLKDARVTLPRIVTSTDQGLSQKITLFCLRVFVLLFRLPGPLSGFPYYFIAVSESRPLPPPLSLFFFLSLSFSIPSSLPLPIFACATFNCSDMPCGKLCLCVLEQALLVMAVVPDVRGGV